MSPPSSGSNNASFACSFFAWLILRPSKWRWHVPLKYRLAFSRLRAVMSQKRKLLNWIHLTLSHSVTLRSILILSFHLHLCPSSGLFLLGVWIKILYELHVHEILLTKYNFMWWCDSSTRLYQGHQTLLFQSSYSFVFCSFNSLLCIMFIIMSKYNTTPLIYDWLTAKNICWSSHIDSWFQVLRDPRPYFTVWRLWEPSELSQKPGQRLSRGYFVLAPCCFRFMTRDFFFSWTLAVIVLK
jgi:hypothetical protein